MLIGVIIWLITVAVQTVASMATGGQLSGFGGDATITVNDDGTIERFVFDEALDFGTREIVAASVASMLSTVLATSVIAAATSVLYRTRNPRG